MGEMAGWQGGREQGDEGALSNDSNVTTSQLQGSASERSFVVVVGRSLSFVVRFHSSFDVARCCRSSLFVVVRRRSLSFVVVRCRSFAFVVVRLHSLSFVFTRCRCSLPWFAVFAVFVESSSLSTAAVCCSLSWSCFVLDLSMLIVELIEAVKRRSI